MFEKLTKRSVVCITFIIAFVLVFTTLAACSTKLVGTYSRVEDGITFQHTFYGNDQTLYEVFFKDGSLAHSATRSYKISGNTISFIGTKGETDYSFQKKGNTIIIDGYIYTKQ